MKCVIVFFFNIGLDRETNNWYLTTEWFWTDHNAGRALDNGRQPLKTLPSRFTCWMWTSQPLPAWWLSSWSQTDTDYGNRNESSCSKWNSSQRSAITSLTIRKLNANHIISHGYSANCPNCDHWAFRVYSAFFILKSKTLLRLHHFWKPFLVRAYHSNNTTSQNQSTLSDVVLHLIIYLN